MQYEEALAYIHSIRLFGAKLGLETVKTLLRYLGNPQKCLKFIHIAGTNGKGSTAAMTAQILQEAGFRTGLFTSPYLYRFNERMRVDGEQIADGLLADLTTVVRGAYEALVRDGYQAPSEFEVVFAIAMLYFLEMRCDYVALEVGMGGRLDATNSIDPPCVCCITSVSYDHQQYLGETLPEIAREKCGIIKDGSLVVSYPLQEPAVLAQIEQAVLAHDGLLFVPPLPEIESQTPEGSVFIWQGSRYRLSLPGTHQVYNAAAALSVIEALRLQGAVIPEQAAEAGLAKVAWPGRFEKIKANPCVYIDCAHNPDGVRACCDAINAFFGDRKKILVMGMLEDKDYAACVRLAAQTADVLIAAEPDNPRALPAAELAKLAEPFCSVTCVPCGKDALAHAESICGENDMIFVLGSFYLLGTL